MKAPARAALFDVDGTLIDSNYLHVEAWARAFASVGRPVDAWRIHRSIGMDSARLLETLLGDDAERLGGIAADRHSGFYANLGDRLRRLPGARELLTELAGRGVRVVLATSASPDELEVLRTVLDAGDTLDAVTSSADVDTAKPEPDIVQVALRRAGVPADTAVFIGDSVWDVEAARRAGVRAIGVRSGGVSAAELLEAGAVAVYDDAADLLADADRMFGSRR